MLLNYKHKNNPNLSLKHWFQQQNIRF